MFEKVGPRDDSEEAVFCCIGGCYGGGQHQRCSDTANQKPAKPCHRGIDAENLCKNLSDQSEFQWSFDQQSRPVYAPEIFSRNRGRHIGRVDRKLANGTENGKRKERRKLRASPRVQINRPRIKRRRWAQPRGSAREMNALATCRSKALYRDSLPTATSSRFLFHFRKKGGLEVMACTIFCHNWCWWIRRRPGLRLEPPKY